MNGNLLMNCLWYEDIPPVRLAEVLEISPETLCDKIFGDVEFSDDEIRKIVDLLTLTEDEVYLIFYK